MRKYELLMLTSPYITNEEERTLESAVVKMIEGGKGVLITYDKWGKCRLAYPIKKHEFSNFYLIRFEADDGYSKIIAETDRAFKIKFHNLVMRHMFTRLEDDAPVEYKRPRAVEEVPSRNVESFIKENRMEGFLSEERPPSEAVRVGGSRYDSRQEQDKPSEDSDGEASARAADHKKSGFVYEKTEIGVKPPVEEGLDLLHDSSNDVSEESKKEERMESAPEVVEEGGEEPQTGAAQETKEESVRELDKSEEPSE